MFKRILVLAGLLLAAPVARAQLRLDVSLPGGERFAQTEGGERKAKRKVTLDSLAEGKGGKGEFALGAAPVTWIDDEHFLQSKGGKPLLKVHALSGDAVPFHDPAKLAEGLAALPGFAKDKATLAARNPLPQLNSK